MSPLNLAIEKNNIEIIKLLLEKKDIDVNFVRKYSKNEYHEYRGDCNDDKLKKESTPLYQAVENNNIEIVQLLISNENINGNFKNHFYKNHENYYTNRYTDFNCEEENIYETSLYLAVKTGNVELVKILLSCKNIDVDSENTYSSREENKENERKINKSVETPLQRAENDSNFDIIELLSGHSKINLDD